MLDSNEVSFEFLVQTEKRLRDGMARPLGYSSDRFHIDQIDERRLVDGNGFFDSRQSQSKLALRTIDGWLLGPGWDQDELKGNVSRVDRQRFNRPMLG